MKVITQPTDRQYPSIGLLSTGDTFQYERFQYMKIRIKCAGLYCNTRHENYPYDTHKLCACVNLKSGTIRLLERETEVLSTKAEAHVTIRNPDDN